MAEGLRSMGQVRVTKEFLVEKLTHNRANHRQEFQQAHKDYEEAVVAWFEEQRDLALEKKRFVTYFDLQEPQDHTSDYDQALEMLEASRDDEFIISQGEFRQYVRDEWGWQAETKEGYATASATNALYKRARPRI